MGFNPIRDAWTFAREHFNQSREFTGSEQQFLAQVESGKVTDFGPQGFTGADVACGRTWGTDRSVRGEVIARLCALKIPGFTIHPGGIRVRGVAITGQLNLRGLTITSLMYFEHCWFEQPVLFDDARLSGIELVGCHVPGISGARSIIKGTLNVSGAVITGESTLTDSTVESSFIAEEAQWKNPEGVALSAERLAVRGSLLFERIRAEGRIDLREASFLSLILTEAQLHHKKAVALDGAMLVARGSVYVDQANIEGEIILNLANIGGALNLENSSIAEADGVAFDASEARVSGSIVLVGFKAQ